MAMFHARPRRGCSAHDPTRLEQTKLGKENGPRLALFVPFVEGMSFCFLHRLSPNSQNTSSNAQNFLSTWLPGGSSLAVQIGL